MNEYTKPSSFVIDCYKCDYLNTFSNNLKLLPNTWEKKKISTEFKGSIVKRVIADTGPWIMKLE